MSQKREREGEGGEGRGGAPTKRSSSSGQDASTNLWRGRSVTSVSGMTSEALAQLMRVASALQRNPRGFLDSCRGRVLACAFYEPSTRTSCSFSAAMQRLGGTVLNISAEGSSVKKGETLEDTVRCLESYADIVVLRHPVKGSADRAAKAMRKPLLNAGDGAGEHPTQALLDLYTICSELSIDFDAIARGTALAGKVVVMLGDLKFGRTVHSLARLIAKHFPQCHMRFVSPAQLKMPEDVVAELRAMNPKLDYSEHSDLMADGVIEAANVLYVTRVQKERFDNPAEYESIQGSFVVNRATLTKALPTCAVLHPLPRVGEIADEVDSDPRAAYFRQMENGMWVRMALMGLVLGDLDAGLA